MSHPPLPPLADVRRRLSVLGRRLRWVRWGTAWPPVATAGLVAGAAIFLCDVWLDCSRVQRLLLTALALAAGGWTYWRFSRPYLRQRESDVELALHVERQHPVDNDLVAALQFAAAPPSTGGSPALEEEVIRRAANWLPRLDLFRGIDYRPLIARTGVLLGATALVLIVAACYPRHMLVYVHRLLLSNRRYPTRTTIEQIVVNQTVAYRYEQEDLQPVDVRCARNQPVTFLVRSSTAPPAGGWIRCQSSDSDRYEALALRPVSGRKGWYTAALPHLVEPFQYRVECGDATTEPAVVRVIELPAVELSFDITPPSYAGAAESTPQSPRQLSVLDGSHVALAVRCLNDKSLVHVRVHCVAADREWDLPLVPQDGEGRVWRLPGGQHPFAPVTQEFRYRIDVIDEDRLRPEASPAGEVRLRPDRPPTAMAQVLHRRVLPTAAPVIEYRLHDDFGISSATLVSRIERPAGGTPAAGQAAPIASGARAPGSGDVATTTETAAIRLELPLPARPLRGADLPQRGAFPLDLSRLSLRPGDRLQITVETIDDRGPRPGQMSRSEPVTLEITDEAGVLSAISALDEQAESILGTAIEQQLDVGDAT